VRVSGKGGGQVIFFFLEHLAENQRFRIESFQRKISDFDSSFQPKISDFGSRVFSLKSAISRVLKLERSYDLRFLVPRGERLAAAIIGRVQLLSFVAFGTVAGGAVGELFKRNGRYFPTRFER